MAEEDDIFPIGLGIDEARERIAAIGAMHRLQHEQVQLEAALNRILAVDIAAPRDVPAFANSAMDGYAVRAADLPAAGEKAFELRGEIFAGGSNSPEVGPDTCVRIMTGAPLPRGADTVVMKENARVD